MADNSNTNNQVIRTAILAANKTKRLDLSYMQLTEIPAGIFKLKHLEDVNLSNNKITSIPACISNLTNLKRLDISCNSIESISDKISECTSLEFLNVANNSLTILPPSLGTIAKLKSVTLYANKLNLPAYIVPQEIEGLKSYLLELFEEQEKVNEEQREIKGRERAVFVEQRKKDNKNKRLNRQYKYKMDTIADRKDAIDPNRGVETY